MKRKDRERERKRETRKRKEKQDIFLSSAPFVTWALWAPDGSRVTAHNLSFMDFFSPTSLSVVGELIVAKGVAAVMVKGVVAVAALEVAAYIHRPDPSAHGEEC